MTNAPGAGRPSKVVKEVTQAEGAREKAARIPSEVESSKFEPGAITAEVIQQVAGDAQTIFLLLLAIARGDGERSEADRELRFLLATDVAAALERVAVRLSRGETSAIDRDDALGEIERAIAAQRVHDRDQDAMGRGTLVLYREAGVE
jgi:hypothetical protein